MSKTIISESIGTMEDLITPSLTRKYALGKIISVEDSANQVINRYIYVKAHTTLTAYQPYVLNFTGTAGAEVKTAAPATTAAPGQKIVIPQVAFTSGYYGWVLYEGMGSVLMTAETYAVGDYLQILNAGTALVVDGSTGATVMLDNSCAVCRAAGTTAVAKAVYLINKLAVTAAA